MTNEQRGKVIREWYEARQALTDVCDASKPMTAELDAAFCAACLRARTALAALRAMRAADALREVRS